MPRMRYATVAYFNEITQNLTGGIQKHDSKHESIVILRRVPIYVLITRHLCGATLYDVQFTNVSSASPFYRFLYPFLVNGDAGLHVKRLIILARF